ncbi:MAG: phytanoyl-CoA dioxygenase family protein [Pseudomonadota bacterium]
MSTLFTAKRQLTVNKYPIDMSSHAFGELRESSDCLSHPEQLRARMQEDGYIFLRNYLNKQTVLNARKDVLQQLSNLSLIDNTVPMDEARGVKSKSFKKLDFDKKQLPAVRDLTTSDALSDFYRILLDGEPRTFDHFWVRALSPKSNSETVHSDIVYMGQGTQNLYTNWIPLGDVPKEQGPIMILEKSHQIEEIKFDYCQWDVDRNPQRWRFKHGQLFRGGHYSRNAPAVQKEFGLRWLTADFNVGDVVMFSTYALHCALDNLTDEVRISTDNRYQLASDPIDPRWVGEEPIGNLFKKNNHIFSRLNVPYHYLLKLMRKKSELA